MSCCACWPTTWNDTCAGIWHPCASMTMPRGRPKRPAPLSWHRPGPPMRPPERPGAGAPLTAIPSTASRPCWATSQPSPRTPSNPALTAPDRSPSSHDPHHSRPKPSNCGRYVCSVSQWRYADFSKTLCFSTCCLMTALDGQARGRHRVTNVWKPTNYAVASGSWRGDMGICCGGTVRMGQLPARSIVLTMSGIYRTVPDNGEPT